MSKRGLRLFNDYVARRLVRPEPAFGSEDHADHLVAAANAAGIPALEITEEVGAIADALAVVMARMERDVHRDQERRPADLAGEKPAERKSN